MKGSLTIKEEKRMTAKKKYKITIPKERCKGCGLCVYVCKKDVLKMSEEEETNEKSYRFAKVVNQESCTGCINCCTVCPDVCIEIKAYN